MARLIDDTTVCAHCGGERWPTTLYAEDDAPICGQCYRDERAAVVALFSDETVEDDDPEMNQMFARYFAAMRGE